MKKDALQKRADSGVVVTLPQRETCAASCYEVEPGVWIHHPWAGCTTPMLRLPEPISDGRAKTCWHCDGSRRCDCSNCGKLTSKGWEESTCLWCAPKKPKGENK